MSGIAGIYHLNGDDVNAESIRSMVNSMSHRGPDGIHVWNEGPVGLGHCMLHTTPESLNETFPMDSPDGKSILTADARIDNRADLISTFGLTQNPSDITDGELILHSYKKWGDKCVDYLIGDFAFAIWNKNEKKLYLALDHFGVKQIYYFYSDDFIVFGSEIKALLSLVDVPEEIDELIVASYLSGGVHSEKTIFKNIKRILPATYQTISAEKLQSVKYWAVPDQRTADKMTDEEYTDRFFKIFRESVRCRLRSAFPVGAELSGGLDSSFVTTVAADLLKKSGRPQLHTFSTIFNEHQECSEDQYISSVVDNGSEIEPHFIDADQENPLKTLDEIYTFLDDGRVYGNHHLNWLTLRESHKNRVRVLLTGHDGDTTVGHGWRYLSLLVKNGKWKEFAKEARQAVENMHTSDDGIHKHVYWNSEKDVLNHFASDYLIKWAERGHYMKLLNGLSAIRTYFSISPWTILKRMWRKILIPEWSKRLIRGNHENDQQNIPDTISSHLLKKIDLSYLMSLQFDKIPFDMDERDAQKLLFESPFVQLNLETISLYAASFGIEARHPFMDKRLVEFCLSLPVSQSYSGGWSRIIMRRAMKGMVPDKIRWRSGKANLTAPFHAYYARLGNEGVNGLLSRINQTSNYFDISKMKTYYENINSINKSEFDSLVKSINLGYWIVKRSGLNMN